MDNKSVFNAFTNILNSTKSPLDTADGSFSRTDSLVNYVTKTTGKKSIAGYAIKIRNVLKSMTDEQLFTLYLAFKRFPIDPNRFDKVVADNMAAARSQNGNVENKPVKGYLSLAEKVKPLLKDIYGASIQASWDQIAYVLKNTWSPIRDAQQTCSPHSQIVIYQKAYFVGATIDDAETEVLARLMITNEYLTAVGVKWPMKPDEFLKPGKQIPYKTKEIAPNDKLETLPLKDRHSNPNKVINTNDDLLQCSFVMDAKMISICPEYKTGSNAVKVAFQKWFRMYIFLVCNIAAGLFPGENLIPSKELLKGGFLAGTNRDSKEKTTSHTLAEMYYKGLRILRKTLRTIKIARFGGLAGNEARERAIFGQDITDDTDIELVDINRAIKLLNKNK